MKKSLISLLILTVLAMSAFGYSLRTESMGSVIYGIKDFETNVERNPANIVDLEENYFRLTLGMVGAGLTVEDSYDNIDPGTSYRTSTDEYTYSGMPIGVLGFYKFGSIAIGLNFDMPKETFGYTYDYDYRNHPPSTEWDVEQDEDETASSIQNFGLTLGTQVSNFGLGINFGQVSQTITMTESDWEDGDDAWEHDWSEWENEVTADSTFYGLGVKYPTGNMVWELAYKMNSLTAEAKTTKDVWGDNVTTTTGDVSDHDNYPITEIALDSSLIHVAGCYGYNENIDATAAVDIIVHNAEPTMKYSTIPDFTNADVAVNQTNVALGIGFDKDEFKFGLEMNYNMFTLDMTNYNRDIMTDPATEYKSTEVTGDMTAIVWKAGAEYNPSYMKKLTLRVGAIKYAPLSGSVEFKDYWTTGELGYQDTTTIDKGNTANINVASVGFAYQFSRQLCLEYGYIGGRYLWNQNTLLLAHDLGAYGTAVMTNDSMFTPMSFTAHKFSVKYSF